METFEALTPEQLILILRIARTDWKKADSETKERLKMFHNLGRWPDSPKCLDALFSYRDSLLILLAYTHGLRASEVTALRLADIDLKKDEIDIRRLKNSRRTIQKLRIHRGEPLLNEVRNLADWLKIRPTDSGDALFPSARGGCLTGKSFNTIFHKYAEQIGITFGPHTLKHAIGTHLVRAGVDLAYVQAHLGHVSISSTQRYLHLTSREVSEKTNNALMNIF